MPEKKENPNPLHKCLHEVDIALLQESVPRLEASLKNGLLKIDASLSDLNTSIKGTVESPGILTRLALLKQSIGRSWWFIGVIITVLVGVLGFLIRGN